MVSLSQIKDWFKTGLKPTQEQFLETWSSFWHKDETIPQSAVNALEETLGTKVEAAQFSAHLADANAHVALFEAVNERIDVVEQSETPTIFAIALTTDDLGVTSLGEVTEEVLADYINNASPPLVIPNGKIPFFDISSTYPVRIKLNGFIPDSNLLNLTGGVTPTSYDYEGDELVMKPITSIYLQTPASGIDKIVSIEGPVTNVYFNSPAPMSLTDINLTGTSFGFYGMYSVPNLETITALGTTDLYPGGGISDCQKLTTINLPNLTGELYNIYNNPVLTTIYAPSATVIRSLNGNTALVNVDFSSVSLVAYSGLGNCTSLTTLDMPALVTIQDNGLYACTALADINMPALANLNGNGFNGCASLTHVSLPALTSIAGAGFYGCTTLAHLDLPALTTITNGCLLYVENTASTVTINIPSITTMSVNPFQGVAGKTINLTIPAAMAYNSYIVSLMTSNTVTLTLV